MGKVSEIIKSIAGIREHCSEEEQKTLDTTVSIIRNMASSLATAKNREEQIRWEWNTAKSQLKDMGFNVGEVIWHNCVDGNPEKQAMYYTKVTNGKNTSYAMVFFDGRGWHLDKDFDGYEVVKWMKQPIDNT